MSVFIDDHTAEFKRELNERMERALEAAGIHLEGEAKEELENSPRRIDTGLLRNSITHAVSGHSAAIQSYHGNNASKYSKAKYASAPVGYYNGTVPGASGGEMAVYVGSNVEYAPYVHEGTTKMTPNRFLKNAFVKNEKQAMDYLVKELKG